MVAGDQVRIWDEHGQEKNVEDAECWDTWEKCAAAPGFPKGLVQFLKDTERGCGFPAPTTIQSYAWAALVTGKDLIGVAKTGSGKTLAFLLPGFMWLKKNRKSDNPVDTSVGPAILALTPTRELCYQIYADTEKFGTPVKITASFAYGGAPKWEQEQKFRENPDVLIATPGRLADFLRNRAVSLDMCRYCVLDEADRMLDMGFDQQVKEILDWMPSERQMSMFTATWPRSVRVLADKYIKDPLQVQVGSDQLTTNKDVTQHFEICTGQVEKKAALEKILEKQTGSVLIFCNSKKMVKDLTWELYDKGSVELHGDLKQDQRDAAMNKFRKGEAKVMVATDVASRGLDMRQVSCVVNFDAPQSCGEDYVHRIGRTGRAGDKGDAYTFLSWSDEAKAQQILELIESGGQTAPEVLLNLAKGFQSQGWSGSATGEGDDWKKDQNGSGGGGGAEKRVHPSDKTNTAYTWEEFMEFSSGDQKKAERMWNESTAVKAADDGDAVVAAAMAAMVAEEKAGAGAAATEEATKEASNEDEPEDAKDEDQNGSGGGGGGAEKRVHPSDKSNTAYTWDEFMEFSSGDQKKAERMWNESTAVKEESSGGGGTGGGGGEEKRDDKRKAEGMGNESTVVKVPRTEAEELTPEEEEEVVEALKADSGSSLTAKQIKGFLLNRGLSTSGAKTELLERALEAVNS